MSHASRRVGDIVMAVQDYFLENPGLALTPWQIERLCGADAKACEAILDLLAGGGVIARTGDGRYVRCVAAPRRWRDQKRAGLPGPSRKPRLALAG